MQVILRRQGNAYRASWDGVEKPLSRVGQRWLRVNPELPVTFSGTLPVSGQAEVYFIGAFNTAPSDGAGKLSAYTQTALAGDAVHVISRSYGKEPTVYHRPFAALGRAVPNGVSASIHRPPHRSVVGFSMTLPEVRHSAVVTGYVTFNVLRYSGSVVRKQKLASAKLDTPLGLSYQGPFLNEVAAAEYEATPAPVVCESRFVTARRGGVADGGQPPTNVTLIAPFPEGALFVSDKDDGAAPVQPTPVIDAFSRRVTPLSPVLSGHWDEAPMPSHFAAPKLADEIPRTELQRPAVLSTLSHKASICWQQAALVAEQLRPQVKRHTSHLVAVPVLPAHAAELGRHTPPDSRSHFISLREASAPASEHQRLYAKAPVSHRISTLRGAGMRGELPRHTPPKAYSHFVQPQQALAPAGEVLRDTRHKSPSHVVELSRMTFSGRREVTRGRPLAELSHLASLRPRTRVPAPERLRSVSHTIVLRVADASIEALRRNARQHASHLVTLQTEGPHAVEALRAA